ncbi:MAG: ABC transporter substrate-binding protein, partial [Pseudomonadota bacterium]
MVAFSVPADAAQTTKGSADAPTIAKRLHAIAMHGTPKYAAGFNAFSHVNLNAPKGGTLRLGLLGSFDSLNPFIIKGVAAAGLRGFVYESVLTRGPDEAFTLYAGIAHAVEMPDDRSSITFHIDKGAQFSDGEPIDADDLIFSWRTLRDLGRPNHRTYYAKVTEAKRLDAHTVRFELGDGSDRELPLILGLMPVLPSHALTPDTFNATTLKAPVGSGPYAIEKIEAGRAITYRRRGDWWGKDRPVNRGRFNFDTVRYDYYRDAAPLFEAFKTGRIDLRLEEAPTNWAEGYDFKAAADGQ